VKFVDLSAPDRIFRRPSLHKTHQIITITAIMYDTHGTKKHEYDKIALLGLFVLSLLMAYLIVAFKSKLLFSDPIQLPQMGLSVPMPSGHGWQSDEQWNFHENKFSLSSLFPRGSDRPTAWASCRYLLSAETATPQTRFQQRASAINAVIGQTNQIQTDILMIDWARIDIPELHFSMFFGTSRLPDNRQLDIEVGQIAGEVELAERIFKGIIEDLKFEDNQLLKAGAEIVAEIKSKGIESFLNNQNRQTYFLIKDEAKQNIGFTMDMISATNNQSNIRANSRFYMKGQNSVDHIAAFHCSNNLEKFVYNSETSSQAGRSSAEIVLDTEGTITIIESQTQHDETSYQLGPAMIPDVFLDQLLKQMLDSKKDQIIIDIIEATGKIIPTLLSAIDTKDTIDADEDTTYAFELELLDGRVFSEQLYLNDQQQIYKRLVRQDVLYILESTSAENIAKEFPEHI
jgi:hypothetical protein